MMKDFIAETIRQPVDALGPDSGLGSTPGWDSFAHLAIMLELESRFGIDISDEAIRHYCTVRAIDELEAEKGGSK